MFEVECMTSEGEDLQLTSLDASGLQMPVSQRTDDSLRVETSSIKFVGMTVSRLTVSMSHKITTRDDARLRERSSSVTVSGNIGTHVL